MNTLRPAAVILSVLFVLMVFGPEAEAQGFGIKAGPSYSDFSSDLDDLDFDNRVGTFLGAFFGGNRPGVFGLQGEVNWLRKRTEVTGGGIRIDYIQPAALLRLNIGTRSTSGFAVYGLVGPGVNFKIADSLEGIDIEDALDSVDVALLFGGGVEISRVLLEGRYEKGLRRINNNFSDVSEIKTQGFSILVGFRFR